MLRKVLLFHRFSLSGTVIVKNEQYVYFDASKGDLDEIPVSVGGQGRRSASGQIQQQMLAALWCSRSCSAKQTVIVGGVKQSQKMRQPHQLFHRFQQVGLQNKRKQFFSIFYWFSNQWCHTRADAVFSLNKAQAQLDATVRGPLEGTVVINRGRQNANRYSYGSTDVGQWTRLRWGCSNTTLLTFL